MGEGQMKLWNDEIEDADNVPTEPETPTTSQEEISSIGPDQDSESGGTDSVKRYFESIAPEVIELTKENLGLYLTLETAMRKSKLASIYDEPNKVHYKQNTLPFLARNLSQVLQERYLPDDPKIIGDIIRNAIGLKLIIKKGTKTKDGHEFYRLNPSVKKLEELDVDEAYGIFANHIKSLAKCIEKEKITQITSNETEQDALTGFE